MGYPLIQYGCNDCGALTPVMDCDEKLPTGWVVRGLHTHYCPTCSKKHKDDDDDEKRELRIKDNSETI